MELSLTDVFSNLLDPDKADRCLYPECQKVIPPEGGARVGIIIDKRYCDEHCLEAMRCWINFQSILGQCLVEWAEEIRKR